MSENQDEDPPLDIGEGLLGADMNQQSAGAFGGFFDDESCEGDEEGEDDGGDDDNDETEEECSVVSAGRLTLDYIQQQKGREE